MFALSPITGMLVIIHLIVNVSTYFFRKIRIYVRNWFDVDFTWVPFQSLISKEGDTLPRRMLAYAIIPAMLTMVVASSSTIVYTGLRSANTSARENPNYILSEAVQGGKALTGGLRIVPEDEVPAVRKKDVSIIDTLNARGIDSSFESRARLAERLGIVADISLYHGTMDQNEKILYQLEITPSVAITR